MKLLIKSNSELDTIMCMSNVRGNKIVRPKNMPFSFYYSAKSSVAHSIRVKPIFNDRRMNAELAGTLKLCDDWEYIPEVGHKVSSFDIRKMKQFFKDNIVLFCAVWDMQVNEPLLADYLEGDINLHEFIEDLDFYKDYKAELDNVSTVKELEEFCRENNLVNFYQ